MAPTLVYCIRHGQTAENVQAIMQGQLDTQLDSVGIEQAAAVAESLKDVKFGVAFSSDLSRAVDVGRVMHTTNRILIRMPWQTANAILKHHTEVPFRKVAILRERVRLAIRNEAFLRLMLVVSIWGASKVNECLRTRGGRA